MVIKKKGSEVSVHTPTDSYLIGYTAYKLFEHRDIIQHMLYFQASCEVAYRFDHLDDQTYKQLHNLLENITYAELYLCVQIIYKRYNLLNMSRLEYGLIPLILSSL